MKVLTGVRHVTLFVAAIILIGCGFPPQTGGQIRPRQTSWTGVANFAIPVLMYHRVCPLTEREAKSPLTRDLTVLPADFED